MTTGKSRQILLGSRPRGEPTPDNFKLVETDMPEPGPGQMLLRTIYLSLDPYMRGRMNAGPSYFYCNPFIHPVAPAAAGTSP
jgi:NADPH-dependent curcumin reductase